MVLTVSPDYVAFIFMVKQTRKPVLTASVATYNGAVVVRPQGGQAPIRQDHSDSQERIAVTDIKNYPLTF
jgi:hypothetical protein